MNILLIGGGGFMGPPLARELQRRRHAVCAFHRGNAAPIPGTTEIHGDRNRLAEYREQFARFAPEVVVDMILSSGAQARMMMNTIRGIARRVVVLSSIDVYRATAISYGSEAGPLEPVPLTEDSALRQAPPYSPTQVKMLQGVFAWLDDAYDKVQVEREVSGDPELPATVLRLPMVYGPGDPLHRLYPLLKRMDDGRRVILFADDVAQWRGPRGYVENVSAAIALAVEDERAAGRTYNVAEEPAFSELEWAEKVAEQAGWRGEFRVLPHDATPKHLLLPGNTAQHWAASSERIRRELGYREPVPLEEAIRRTIVWERAHPPQVSLAQFDYDAEDAALAA
jgi:nucleoside-diphosphate-sugar epimerase